jgi:hypothetical protein
MDKMERRLMEENLPRIRKFYENVYHPGLVKSEEEFCVRAQDDLGRLPDMCEHFGYQVTPQAHCYVVDYAVVKPMA